MAVFGLSAAARAETLSLRLWGREDAERTEVLRVPKPEFMAEGDVGPVEGCGDVVVERRFAGSGGTGGPVAV